MSKNSHKANYEQTKLWAANELKQTAKKVVKEETRVNIKK